MPRPSEFSFNDVTVFIDECGEVIITWDHGDRLDIADGGGYLIVYHNGKKVLDGEFHKETIEQARRREQRIAEHIDGFDLDDLGESPDY